MCVCVCVGEGIISFGSTLGKRSIPGLTAAVTRARPQGVSLTFGVGSLAVRGPDTHSCYWLIHYWQLPS